MSEFAKNLKRFRKQKNLTQTELGKMLNYGSTAIANYESGRNEPSLDVLIKLSEILDVSTDDLLGVTPKDKIKSPVLIPFETLSDEKKKIVMELINSLQALS